MDNPCGKNAICTDTIGSFICSCNSDYTGDPYRGCVDIDECTALDKPCGNHAICENANPGYNCLCPQGFIAKPDAKIACEQADVNILCRSNFDCTNNAECIEGQCFCQNGFEPQGSICVDVDECRTIHDACGPLSVCINTPGSYRCECEAGFIGAPPRIPCKTPCADVKCGKNAYCKAEGEEAYCMCEEGWTFNPNDIAAGCMDIDECDKVHGPNGKCGVNAICHNLPGGFKCECGPGFSGDPARQCFDIDECSKSRCGENAICKNLEGSYECSCPPGTIADPDPTVKCISVVTCKQDNDCPGNAICDPHKRCLCPEPNIGNDCRHPCEKTLCGSNSKCMLVNGEAQCLCGEGFTGSPGQCTDINECSTNPCPPGAVCTNLPGGYTCECPGGSSGDPYSTQGCLRIELSTCSTRKPCPSGEKCVLDSFSGNNVCVCGQGYQRYTQGNCRDINECEATDKQACGNNALCKNLPGSYECHCAPGFNGNPYLSCDECNSLECQCQAPYKLVDGNCVLSGCDKGKCPPGAECISITGGVSYCACPKGYRTLSDGTCEDINECSENRQACGYGAICKNTLGKYECKCPDGYAVDAYRGICSIAPKHCSGDRDCGTNEKCVQPGECVCPPPFFMDSNDNNKCKSPCERFSCGINAKCTPTDPPQCLCEAGYNGDPLLGCVLEDECSNAPCAYGAHCVNQKGGYKCVCPNKMTGDPYKGGCVFPDVSVKSPTCRNHGECADNLACVQGQCRSPCESLLCGPHAYCEPENHAAWCRCRVGFVQGPTGECVSRK